MKKLIFLLFSIVFSISINAQRQGFGIFYNQNISHQFVSDPSDPDYGVAQTPQIIRLGFGAFFERRLIKQFYLQTRIGYQQKGAFQRTNFVEDSNNPFPPGTRGFRDDIFKFNYLSFELNGLKHFYTDFQVNPFVIGGFSYQNLLDFNYNFDGEIRSNISARRFDNSINHTFATQLGFGIQVKKMIRLDIRTQLDLNSFINDDDLRIRHWLWAINAELDLRKFFKILK